MKREEIDLVFLTDFDMLKIVQKGISVMCHKFPQYAKVNNKYMKNYNKSKESSYLMLYCMNNLHSQIMSQILPMDNFQREKNIKV